MDPKWEKLFNTPLNLFIYETKLDNSYFNSTQKNLQGEESRDPCEDWQFNFDSIFGTLILHLEPRRIGWDPGKDFILYLEFFDS